MLGFLESFNKDKEIIELVNKFNECNIDLDKFMEEFYVNAYAMNESNENLQEDMQGIGGALGKGWNAAKTGWSNFKSGFQQGNQQSQDQGGSNDYYKQLAAMNQAYSILQKSGLQGAFGQTFDQYYKTQIEPNMSKPSQAWQNQPQQAPPQQGQPSASQSMTQKMDQWQQQQRSAASPTTNPYGA